MVDGCSFHNVVAESVARRWDTAEVLAEPCAMSHGVTGSSVEKRWETIEAIIARTPEDDHFAQWSVIAYCSCCGGPKRTCSYDDSSDGRCTRCPESSGSESISNQGPMPAGSGQAQ